jgi:hypothetical protein
MKIPGITAAVFAATLWTGTAPAQDTLRVLPLDSLTERLRRAEQAIELLREQLATEAASKVQAASRVRVDLFGRVLTNAFSNSHRVNNADVPQFVARSDSLGGGLGMSIRQTSLGISVQVPQVLGGTFDGEIHTDFYGGQQTSSGGRHFPLLRVRTARGILRWQHGEVLFGQEVPLIVGINPVSVASVGTPEFVTAGNLWLWLPQFRATWILTRTGRLALQGAVLAPTTGDPVGTFDTDLDAAERSKRPYLQGRIRAQWGEGETLGEIGVGVHRGWVRRTDGSLLASEAVAADAIIPLGRHVALRGEAYSGQALRGLGGGGISQNLTLDGRPVEDIGGWAQIDVRPNTLLAFAAGCGVGDPDDVDSLPAGRLKNRVCALSASVRPGGPLLLSLGWRSHQTTYATGTASNKHFNIAFGFEY